jgi:hypothetical protein
MSAPGQLWEEGAEEPLILRAQGAELTPSHPFVVRALTVLWPAFFMAGVLEMLVFVVVDPAELRWFGGELLGWSSMAVYTATFLIFWGVISMAGAMSLLLATPEEGDSEIGRRSLRWP